MTARNARAAGDRPAGESDGYHLERGYGAGLAVLGIVLLAGSLA